MWPLKQRAEKHLYEKKKAATQSVESGVLTLVTTEVVSSSSLYLAKEVNAENNNCCLSVCACALTARTNGNILKVFYQIAKEGPPAVIRCPLLATYCTRY